VAVQRTHRRRLDGPQEASLVAVAWNAPADGCERWTLRACWSRLALSSAGARRSLSWCRPGSATRGSTTLGVFPPRRRPRVFLTWRMPWTCLLVRPFPYAQVCLDEITSHRLADIDEPLSMEPGTSVCQNDENECGDVCHVFLAGKALSEVPFICQLADSHSPDAVTSVVVMNPIQARHSDACSLARAGADRTLGAGAATRVAMVWLPWRSLRSNVLPGLLEATSGRRASPDAFALGIRPLRARINHQWTEHLVKTTPVVRCIRLHIRAVVGQRNQCMSF